jgi:chorismate mutase
MAFWGNAIPTDSPYLLATLLNVAEERIHMMDVVGRRKEKQGGS